MFEDEVTQVAARLEVPQELAHQPANVTTQGHLQLNQGHQSLRRYTMQLGSAMRAPVPPVLLARAIRQ